MSSSLMTSLVVITGLLCGQATAEPSPAKEYSSAQAAFQEGAKHLRAMDYKASRAPFEAALKLAKDDAYRVKVYQALLPAYRQIPEFEPFQTAAEFIVTHAEQDATRSLTRRAFLSFAYNRGQIDQLAERYEARLGKDKKDYTALYLLSELYAVTRKNPKRAVELIEQLAALEAEPKKGGETQPLSPQQAAKLARTKAKLAQQYMRNKDYRQAAQLYEEIAPLDETTQAWNLKEAATACLLDGERKDALRLVIAADKVPSEARNESLAHFFHRKMGDLFLTLDQPGKAVGHFKLALEKTQNEGYVTGTQKSLDAALEKSGKEKK